MMLTDTHQWRGLQMSVVELVKSRSTGVAEEVNIDS